MFLFGLYNVKKDPLLRERRRQDKELIPCELSLETVWRAAIKSDGFSTDPLPGESKYTADLNMHVSVEQKTSLSLDVYDTFMYVL